MLDSYLDTVLADLEQKGLLRHLHHTQSAQAAVFQYDDRQILNFCSNNYLGLANDSRLGQAVLECLKKEGYGSGAARLVCGNMPSHDRLEEQLAKFKKQESALLFTSGYMANTGIISSLFKKGDMLFSDRLNHASIMDGIRLSGATLKRYKHNDMAHLEELLQQNTTLRKRCIITDSVFSMDGDMAPLDQIVKLAKQYDCYTMIDEAHALGVLGAHGRGCAEHFGVEKEIDIQMGTFSKAAGSFGAYCVGSRSLISFLINKARSFVYTTGLPPLVAAANCKAIEIIEQDKRSREHLEDNANYMRAGLKLAGFDTMHSITPIIPVLVKESALAILFSKKLFAKGVFVSAIRPPTVPANTARLRLTVMATHTKTDMDYALKSISKDWKGIKGDLMPLIKGPAGIEWNYDCDGEGKTMVLFHGWGVDKRMWRQQIKHFQQTVSCHFH